MSHGHYKALAIFPLLGILCISPSDMHKQAYSRGIASESFDSIPYPKFSKLAEKIDEKLIIKDHKVSFEDFNKQVTDLEKSIKDKGASQENVKAILQAQSDINKLLTDKVIDSEKGIEGLDKLSALKDQIEKIKDEKKEEPKAVVVKEVEKKEDPKKEEKKDEPKKEVAKKKEPKKDEESEHAECSDEQHKVLTTSIQTLVKDQSAIMQNMMNMMQMMMLMNSQSQMAMNEMKYNNQYQYSNPNSNGNWNYYADRFPMYQPNIFSQQQPQQQQQMQQPQTGWNLAPSQQFQLPQMQNQMQMQGPMASFNTGSFSMTPQSPGMMGTSMIGQGSNPFSFNLGV